MSEDGFYRKLKMPAEITRFLQNRAGTSFQVFADPITGEFCGIVRDDIYQELLVELAEKEWRFIPNPKLT